MATKTSLAGSPNDAIRTRLDLTRRPRRLRRTAAMRALVRETRLSPDMFMLPLFVCEGEGVRREVASMPGVFNLSVDEAVKEARPRKADGIRSVLLFGLPDAQGRRSDRRAYDPEAPVQSAIRAIKREVPGPAGHRPTSASASTPTTATAASSIDDEIVNDADRRAAGARRASRTPPPAPTSSRRRT